MNYTELNTSEFLKEKENFKNSTLIDVREGFEHDENNIGGINIPMGDILSNIEKLETFEGVFLYCKSGKRSKTAAHHLCKKINSKVYTLKGGITEYLEQNG